jgi:hypothetical protein
LPLSSGQFVCPCLSAPLTTQATKLNGGGIARVVYAVLDLLGRNVPDNLCQRYRIAWASKAFRSHAAIIARPGRRRMVVQEPRISN